MKTTVKGTAREYVLENDESLSGVALGVILVGAGVIGLWGISCLVGGLATAGLGGLVKGFIAAITVI